MKKVVLITQGDPARVTGGFLYHQKLAERLADYGVELEFISFPEWSFPCPVAAVPFIYARWMRARPSATLVDSLVAAYFAPLSLLGKPYVGIVHQLPGGIDHGVLRRSIQLVLDCFVYRRAGSLIACSGWLAARLDELNQKIFVAEPGCEKIHFTSPKMDLRLGRRAAILCVGHWQPVKGLELLLEAFSRLPQELATLHLVGDNRAQTDYGKMLLKRLDQPDLKGRVVVYGSLEPARLRQFYHSSDFFALASRGETYGSVYAEALSAGLPLVGWRTGNLPHLVEHEKEALLISFGEVHELAGALSRLSENSELREAMAGRAAEKGARLPTWTDTTRIVLEALNVGP